MVGIAHTVKVLNEVGDIAEKVVSIVKHRSIIGAFPAIVGMFNDVKDLVAVAPLALPELKDVDQAEAGILASATYAVVRRIVVAVTTA